MGTPSFQEDHISQIEVLNFLQNLNYSKFSLAEEKTTFAHLLQTADQKLQLLKAKVEKMKEQRKGMMQVLLTSRVRLKI